MEYNSIYEVRKAWLGALGESAEGADNTFEVSKRILGHYQGGPVPPVPPTPPGIDYDGLIFHSNVDGSSISMTNTGGNTPNLEYSFDGVNWETWDYTAISFDKDEEVAFRGTNTSGFQGGEYKFSVFTTTGSVSAKGNIMGIVDGGACSAVTIPNTYCFYRIFRNSTGLTDASKLELPVTTLKEYCYSNMFEGCSNLISAPELPATTLANNCYLYMFWNCTSLINAPTKLPATTLALGCYSLMFRGCTSLVNAPELPATTLEITCYQNMLNGCSSLNYIKCLATNISAANCTSNWVKNVSPTGTFVKNPNMTGWKTGNNGIPSGWTVVDA